ncbi:hypothetical protein ABTY59_31610 [Streptomyces sp. NPDC096079]|uniref:hypothetical protein n=1 Tax=unclassified Streptomyces TaxID=2593676 RepID=UPI00333412C3
MARRGWSVVVLPAIALLVHLVMPDMSASSKTVETWGITAASGTARNDSGQPVLTSDDVTVQPRSTVPGHPSSHAQVLLWVPRDATPPAAPSFGAPADDRVRATLRPALSVLQVLRC